MSASIQKKIHENHFRPLSINPKSQGRMEHYKSAISSKAALQSQWRNKDFPRQGQVKAVHVHQACIMKNTQKNNTHGTEQKQSQLWEARKE
jgi:hypothetical protein